MIKIETPDSALYKCKKKRWFRQEARTQEFHQKSNKGVLKAIKLPCVKTN